MYGKNSDTIAAVATGGGGAIDIIRVSGPDALSITGRIFEPISGKDLAAAGGYTLHYGTVRDGDQAVDDVIVSVFRAPHSYTGDDMVEISCHGSKYIRGRIMSLLASAGARPAQPGEFTMRAFMAGKMDLSQAEAVADIIASEDRASHALAANQMKGGYSSDLRLLRDSLVEIASLLELELDFSEEDVQFADRQRLASLTERISEKIKSLIDSFDNNNVVKEGIPVAIAGDPNTGKSTLLNALLREDRAMVSEIAGTTRDLIEESVVLDGVRFRFTDTAGLRETDDRLENMGIERARNSILRSRIVLYVAAPQDGVYGIEAISRKIAALNYAEEAIIYLVLNKSDILSGQLPEHDIVTLEVNADPEMVRAGKKIQGTLLTSAKKSSGVDELKAALASSVDTTSIYAGATIVTNIRHYDALSRSMEALRRVKDGLESAIPSDLLAGDIRDALYHIGMITGEITNDEILGSIFSKFCIGK